MRASRPAAVALLLLAVSFAGCFGEDEPEESTGETNGSFDQNDSLILPEPNGTGDPDNFVGVDEPPLVDSFEPEESTEPPAATTPEPPAPPPAATPPPPAATPPPPPPAATPPPPPPATTPPPPPPATTPPPPPPPSPTPPPPTPTPPPPASWPVEGSFVRYAYTGGENAPDASYTRSVTARIHLTYQGGSWSGTCVVTTEEGISVSEEDGQRTYRWNNQTRTESVSYPPLVAATSVAVGQTVPVPVIEDGCRRVDVDAPVVGRETHSAPRSPEGQDSWKAQYQREWPEAFVSWWDASAGLVLAWDHDHRNSGHHGWLIDTDAPL